MKWISHLIGVLKMALNWAIFWGITGAIIAVISGFLGTPDGVGLDPSIALATPGFVGGVLFYIIFRVFGGADKFYELSLKRLAQLGATTGAVMGILPFIFGSSNVDFSPWLLGIIIIGSTTLMSIVTAVGTALAFKQIKKG